MKDNPFKRLNEVADIADIVATQRGIIQFAKAAAMVLAEAGLASNKAIGDSPAYAIKKWSAVIQDEAIEIARQRMKSESKKKSSPALMPPV